MSRGLPCDECGNKPDKVGETTYVVRVIVEGSPIDGCLAGSEPIRRFLMFGGAKESNTFLCGACFERMMDYLKRCATDIGRPR